MKSTRSFFAVALVLAFFTSAHGQPAPGRLLVASASVSDPNFAETVLLVLVHQDAGSAAVFLNRPTWLDPAATFPEVSALLGYEGTLYLGGPVGVAELLLLFEAEDPAPDAALALGEGIHFSANLELLRELDPGGAERPNVRVYAGHAEWGPGQLAAEIAAGRWHVLRAEPAQVFSDDPALWQRLVLARDGVSAAAF